MFQRKAVFFAVAGLLASSGYALAGNAPKTSLSLDPTVITADAPADRAPLMMALDKVGAAKPLDDIGLNIYGWVESGYSYNHRHASRNFGILPGPFNVEHGNHYTFNQLDIRFERQVDTKKFDVGGMVEVLYGLDANHIHSTGLPFWGSDPSTTDQALATRDTNSAYPGFDIPQAYVTVNIPVGNGLQLKAGKFDTLLGYETVDPRGNLFYSHSWIFNALPYSATGILGTYQFTDALSVTAGISRGWDQTLEDSGPNGGSCAIDALGNITYKINNQITAQLNWSTGPENFMDTSHYRTALDPIVTWAVTDKLNLAVEGLYIYDGGMNGNAPSVTHAYGDVWGAAAYASYTVNEYLTVNARAEKAHAYSSGYGGYTISQLPSVPSGAIPALNAYEITLGVTVTPMPKDPILKNLSVRPEIRYDFTDSSAYRFFPANGNFYKDQLTFAADVIFKF